MTYYDDFEMDCGCRMHCRCGKNDNGRKLGEVESRNAALTSENRRLREQLERAEAELAWRRQTQPSVARAA